MIRNQQGRRPGSDDEDEAAIEHIGRIMARGEPHTVNGVSKELGMGVGRACRLLDEWRGRIFTRLVVKMPVNHDRPEPGEWER